MRIADITNLYSDVGGGVRTYHHRKLEYFSTRPEYSYALIVPGAENRTVEHPGGRIHYVKGFPVQAKDSGPGYYLFRDALRIGRLFAQERPEIVEIGGPYTDPFLARLARLRSDPVYVGFYHLEFRDAHIEPWIRSWPGWARSLTMGFFDRALHVLYQDTMRATFVASEVVKRELAEIGITNTILTPLGVDIEKFDPRRRDDAIRESWGVGPDDVVLLHSGRMCIEKGTRTILDAAGSLLEDQKVHLVFAGRGGLSSEVDALAARHPRCHSLGYVSDPAELGAVFASSDAYLATGPYETFGLCVLEALASGLAVIATDEGAGPELVVNSDAGLLFEANVPASLAEAAERLLATDLALLGRRGRDYAERHGSWERTFDRMFAAYRELLDERRVGEVRSSSSPSAWRAG